ncbi:MAG: hypothetical protein ACLSFO_05090 [Anaerovoracaceae bacterium]
MAVSWNNEQTGSAGHLRGEKTDLVCVSPKANPPVCKILDYGKYKYELQKRKRKPRKQKTTRSKKSGCRCS